MGLEAAVSPDPSPGGRMVGGMTVRLSPDLCWLDVETTGLDERAGHLLEVGIVLTDVDLRECARGSWVLHFSGEVDDVIAGMHGPGGSGLLTAALASPLSREGASEAIVDWCRAHGVVGEVQPILANSNPRFDRRWLRAHLPHVDALLSHRELDLLSLYRAFSLWAGARTPPRPAVAHRALLDLDHALVAARRYRSLLARVREVAP